MIPATKATTPSSDGISNNNITSPTAAAAADAISNTVELLVNAAELREAAVRESSVANGVSTTAGGGGQAAEAAAAELENVAALPGGPFTASELGQLFLISNSASSSTSAATNSNNNNNNNTTVNNSDFGVWSSLGEDLLSTLTPMLRTHVISASGIDLVGEGRNVITRLMMEEDGAEKKKNNGIKPTITILQVSVYTVQY